jgi:signal transduction histidine kinase
LHDGLGQQLGGLLFLMIGLENDLHAAGAPQAGAARQLSRELATALTQARNLAHELYAVPPQPDGLVQALDNLAERTATPEMECVFTGNTALLVHNPVAASHLYRIAQEAVQNARKHSRATRIDLQLALTPAELELRILDNGTGLAESTRPRGLGLHTMEQRARMLGGCLWVRPRHEGGVEVLCSVPRVRLAPATPAAGTA